MPVEITNEIAASMKADRKSGMQIIQIAKKYNADKMDTRNALLAEDKPKRGRPPKAQAEPETTDTNEVE